MVDFEVREKYDVAVLLGFYEGEDHIIEQLNSIRLQGKNVKIWISDDGDIKQLAHFLETKIPQAMLQNIRILNGPKAGFARNFQSLIGNSEIKADFYAFADQDDVWEEDKLSRAIDWLNTVSKTRPALYCSRTLLVDAFGNKIGFSPLFKKKPSFKNALVQSIAGGNTMVMNNAARELLATTKEMDIVSHDWWAYILVTGAGGEVFYDACPSILYRQHHRNLVGENSSLYSKLVRVFMMLRGNMRDWNSINYKALNEFRLLLTPENQEIVDVFCQAREESLLKRVFHIWKIGLYRQTLCGTIGLLIATILKKI